VWELVNRVKDEVWTIFETVIALYIVVNPTSVSSVFISVTRKASPARRFGIALRAVITGAIILAVFAWAGDLIFRIFKISSAAVQIAGGIFVFGVAFAMARGKEGHFFGQLEEEAHADETVTSVAYSPLAVPMIAGPASITVVMAQAARASDFESNLVVFIAIAGVCGLCLLSMFRLLRLVERKGPGLALILPRIMGFLLAVIAIRFIVNGLLELVPEFSKVWHKGIQDAIEEAAKAAPAPD
jgi:multiple antibiotic resistance protein